LGAASLRALLKGPVFEFSFYAVHAIELKFTIDIRLDLWYVALCYPERTSLIDSFALPLTLDLSITCPLLNLLPLFFQPPSFAFNSLQPLSPKCRGWHTLAGTSDATFSLSRIYL
jgi:hypothetical protein